VHTFMQHYRICWNKNKIKFQTTTDTMKIFLQVANSVADQLGEILRIDVKARNYCLGETFRPSLTDSKPGLPGSCYIVCTVAQFKGA
jgi:hypothetical protein